MGDRSGLWKFHMALNCEHFPPIFDQSAKHVGCEEGGRRAHGLAKGVTNPAGFADGLDEDGESDAADEISFRGFDLVGGSWIDAGFGKMKVTAIRDPKELPHKDLNVDIALECTGLFTDAEKAKGHIAAARAPTAC